MPSSRWLPISGPVDPGTRRGYERKAFDGGWTGVVFSEPGDHGIRTYSFELRGPDGKVCGSGSQFEKDTSAKYHAGRLAGELRGRMLVASL